MNEITFTNTPADAIEIPGKLGAALRAMAELRDLRERRQMAAARGLVAHYTKHNGVNRAQRRHPKRFADQMAPLAPVLFYQLQYRSGLFPHLFATPDGAQV